MLWVADSLTTVMHTNAICISLVCDFLNTEVQNSATWQLTSHQANRGPLLVVCNIHYCNLNGTHLKLLLKPTKINNITDIQYWEKNDKITGKQTSKQFLYCITDIRRNNTRWHNSYASYEQIEMSTKRLESQYMSENSIPDIKFLFIAALTSVGNVRLCALSRRL